MGSKAAVWDWVYSQYGVYMVVLSVVRDWFSPVTDLLRISKVYAE